MKFGRVVNTCWLVIMKNKYSYFFWILLLVLTLVKLLYIGWGPLDLAPDEAHYWDWSRHLAPSYYSKGPVVAYTIFLGTKLGEITGFCPPNPAFWVRFPAVLNSSFLGILAWLLSRKLWRDYRISFYTALILTAIPIYAVGSIIMTVDNPLMLFWALFIYLILLALEREKSNYWYLAGVVLGLGLLTKYTMIILIPCLIFYLIGSIQHRFWLRRKEFFLCLGIAVLFFLPVVLWNWKHNWIGFRHLQGQAGLAGTSLKEPFFSKNSLWLLGEFIGTQFGVISPGLFFIIGWSFVKAWRVYKKERDYRYSFLFWMGVPLGVFYLFLSFHKACQANWPAPVYFTGAVLAGLFFTRDRWIRFLKVSIWIGLILWLLVFGIDILGKLGVSIPNRLDPTVRLSGWRKLGQEVGMVRDKLRKDGSVFIFSDRYQITSELAFYVPGKPVTYCVNIGRRMNQYDLWEGFGTFNGYNAIYVKHRDREMDPLIAHMFRAWEKLPLVNIWRNSRLIHQYSVFLCYGFKGNFEEIEDEITY